MFKKRKDKNERRYPKTIGGYADKWGIRDFHRTTFSFKRALSLLILFIFLYVIGDELAGLMFPNFILMPKSPKIRSEGELILFIFAELIPMLITVWINANRSNFRNIWRNWRIKYTSKRYPKDHYPLHWTFARLFKDWTMRFVRGVCRHKRLVISSAIILLVIEVLTQIVVTVVFGVSNVPSKNTAILKSMMKQVWELSLCSIVVAPLAEETIFRGWIPVILDRICDLFMEGEHMQIKYWISAFLSSVLFASFHSADASDVKAMIIYIMLALALQWIRHRSKSLIPSALTHGCFNLITALMML